VPFQISSGKFSRITNLEIIYRRKMEQKHGNHASQRRWENSGLIRIWDAVPNF